MKTRWVQLRQAETKKMFYNKLTTSQPQQEAQKERERTNLGPFKLNCLLLNLSYVFFQHQKWLTRWKNEDDVEDERSETRIKSFDETDHYRDDAAAIKIRFNFETFFGEGKETGNLFLMWDTKILGSIHSLTFLVVIIYRVPTPRGSTIHFEENTKRLLIFFLFVLRSLMWYGINRTLFNNEE